MIKRPPWYSEYQMMHDPEKFAAVKMQNDSYEWALAFAKYDSWTLKVDTETFADKTTSEAMSALKNKSRVNRNVRGVRYATIPLTLDGAWLDDDLLACNETTFVWESRMRNLDVAKKHASEYALDVRDEILSCAYRLGRKFNKFTGTYCYFEGVKVDSYFLTQEWLSNDEQWSWLKSAIPMVTTYITKEFGVIVDVVMLYGNVEFPTILETIRLAEQWVSKRDEKLAKVTEMLESGALVLDKHGDVMMPDAPAFGDIPGNGEWAWEWNRDGSGAAHTSAEVDRRLVACLDGNNILRYYEDIEWTQAIACIATPLGWSALADERRDEQGRRNPSAEDMYDLGAERMPDELRGIAPIANAMSFNTLSPERWSEVLARHGEYEKSIYMRIHG